MPYAIELFFDEAASAAVQEMWSQLAPVADSDYVIRNAVYPHVALAVVDDVPDAGRLQEALGSLAQRTPTYPLAPTGIGCFKIDKPVVYIGFDKIGLLKRLHADVAAILAATGLSNHEYYQWDQWQPHCTLAMEFDAENLSPVILTAMLAQWGLPFQVASLALVEYPPTELLWSSPLGAK